MVRSPHGLEQVARSLEVNQVALVEVELIAAR
jgi:hypothetical protein